MSNRTVSNEINVNSGEIMDIKVVKEMFNKPWLFQNLFTRNEPWIDQCCPVISTSLSFFFQIKISMDISAVA